MKQAILLKDLPSCPKDTLFKQDINGNYFRSIKDDEWVDGEVKSYSFTKKEVEENPDWFKLTDYVFMKKYTLNQVKDKIIGKEGTPRRDAYESNFYNMDFKIPKKITSEEALNLLGNTIYEVSYIFFKSIGKRYLTNGKKLRGNGNHMAQQISTAAKELWLERLEDKPVRK